MSDFTTYRSNEDELTSPSSDEKMDTGSESFRSQDTPNSIQSSDFDDHPENVLRLQNPGTKNAEQTPTEALESLKHSDLKVLKNSEVLRLSNPGQNDSLNRKMENLCIDSPSLRPKNLGVSPPRISTLTLTTDHPLKGLGSPDFPDLIPKKVPDEKDLSLSSIEDEKPDASGLYSPQRNTSKNNLYFSENFVTAESILNDSEFPPDVARVKIERRKIVAKFEDGITPLKAGLEGKAGLVGHSTPKCGSEDIPDVSEEDYHPTVDWRAAPQTRTVPNFDLPIEMSTNIRMQNALESPDVVSSSQEDKSLMEALLDPHTGSVALRPTARHHSHQRRKIMLPPEEDRSSLDSVSGSSIECEDEPPSPGPQQPPDHNSDDDTRSKSTNTLSYTSEPIPEYSARDELSAERGWLAVSHTHACDVKVIEPYKRVLSHGGYAGGGAALIVFSACHLPDNARHDYTYVMDNLFLYVIWTLDRLVTDEYILVYLHGSAGRRRLPACHWLHDCYKHIDRRLRKSLKHLYLVHPTFWLKTFVVLTKPFVSSKFFKKLSYVKSLDELMEKVPVDPNAIPDIVKQYDASKKR